MMEIIVNGTLENTEGNTLFDFVKSKNLENKNGIAIALNEAIISKNLWEQTFLSTQDKIVIITATAGG